MEFEELIQMAVTIICAVVASSGFWTLIQKKTNKRDAQSDMLIGLAHDRIMYIGMKYIERGWITGDEYENLNEYLYLPYKQLGGNGSAKKIMDEVYKLPIHTSTYVPKEEEKHDN